jgi:hypothetical protein
MNRVLQGWCEMLLLGTAGSPDVALGAGSVPMGGRAVERDLHVVVRMDFAVADFPANTLEDWPDMCVEVPLIDPCERCKG